MMHIDAAVISWLLDTYSTFLPPRWSLVALDTLKLATSSRLALNSQRSTYLCLPSAAIEVMCPTPGPSLCFLPAVQNASSQSYSSCHGCCLPTMTAS